MSTLTPPEKPLPADTAQLRSRAPQRGRLDWVQVFHDLNKVQEESVLGWVKVQSKVPDADRLRPSVIALRMDASSDLLDVRYEPSTAGSGWWNETWGNETHSRRIAQKIRSQKKELAEIWGWDVWVRWTPPKTLTDEQVATVEAIRKRHAKWDEENKAEVAKRAAAKAEREAMDPFVRRVEEMLQDADDIGGPQADRLRWQVEEMERDRHVAYRKNQRMGSEGIAEWELSKLEDAITRGRRIYEKAQATKRRNKFAGMNAREMRKVIEAEEREKTLARLAKLYPSPVASS